MHLKIEAPELVLSQIKKMLDIASDKSDYRLQMTDGKQVLASASLLKDPIKSELIDDE